MNKQKTPSSKKKLFSVLAATAPFIILGVNLIEGASEKSNPVLVKSIGLISLLFWVGLLIYALWSINKRSRWNKEKSPK